jgi:hypothetical protein
MKDIKQWFEANYLDGDKIQDGQMLSSEFCLEAIKEALQQDRQQLVRRIEKRKKKPAFDDCDCQKGYNQAIDDIINIIKKDE